MQNQKNPTQIHQFIRKHKRKLSPKHKQQQLYTFKSQSNKIQSNLKEEYNLATQKNTQKNQTQIVLDLKNKLSFLKDQMAKIVHSKLQSVHSRLQSAPNDHNTSKLKLLDYYFPKETNKTSIQSGQSLHNVKTQENQKSVQRELKKMKSKQILKFSKIKKSQKFSLISPMKNKRNQPQPTTSVHTNEQPSHYHKQSQSTKQQQQPTKHQNKSSCQSSFQHQVKKLSQKNKLSLQHKLKSIVMEQQNINTMNSTSARHHSQQNNKQTLTLSSVSPYKQQKPAIYEVKITRLNKKLKEQQQQLQIVRTILKQKNDLLDKKQQQLLELKVNIIQVKQHQNQHQVQHQKLSRKLSQIIKINNELQLKLTKQSQLTKTIISQNFTLKQNLNVLQHKLKNRQLQILKLQKIIKNHQNQFSSFTEDKQKIICQMREQLVMNKDKYQTEISQLNRLIHQVRGTQKLRLPIRQQPLIKQLVLQESITKSPRQQSSVIVIPTLTPTTSPKNSLTQKQKEFLTVIKMHQKSIQNYQKDISFLQTQCKNLHHFKTLSKKQQLIIKHLNQLLINQQLLVINQKYDKYLYPTIENAKQTREIAIKRPSGKGFQNSNSRLNQL